MGCASGDRAAPHTFPTASTGAARLPVYAKAAVEVSRIAVELTYSSSKLVPPASMAAQAGPADAAGRPFGAAPS
ncbi:hypothetical protein, partial [Brevibacterium sp. HMSC07C04]|uniref:hypothetical protein n=1 Tax=Brevibacterium sp. HMSC07C04 TaxID=1581130 RepID=UPI0035236F2B